MKKKNLKFKVIFTIFALLCSIMPLTGCGNQNQNIYVDDIQISKKNLYLAEGQTAVISAQVYPFNASNQNYSFESSNNDIVTCEDGFVTAKKAGEATIFVFSEEGGYNDTCNVLVVKAKDNLELNSFNNLNMPPKDLEPIYDFDSSQNTQSPAVETSSKNINFFDKDRPLSVNRIKKDITKKVMSEIKDEKLAAKTVLNELKTEMADSISSLKTQKELFTPTFTNQKNELFSSISKIQNDIFDDIIQAKNSMLNSISELESKVESGEYTVETKNMNGVTFVVIKNNIEDWYNLYWSFLCM